MYMVVSDTHVGDRRADCNLERLLQIFEEYGRPDRHLILNGDIFDLSRNLLFDQRHRDFILASRRFGKVTYVEGNHDWFISGLGSSLGPIFQCVKNIRMTVGEKKFNILHGHQADRIARSRLGRIIVKLNKLFEDIMGVDLQRTLQGTGCSKRVHRRQENRLMRMEQWGDVLISGHTHIPGVRPAGLNRIYINTGDWMVKKDCHYLVIDDDGSFELKYAY